MHFLFWGAYDFISRKKKAFHNNYQRKTLGGDLDNRYIHLLYTVLALALLDDFFLIAAQNAQLNFEQNRKFQVYT